MKTGKMELPEIENSIYVHFLVLLSKAFKPACHCGEQIEALLAETEDT